MSEFKTLKDFANATKQAITTGTRNALNKAASKANTEMKRRLASATGLKASTINKRLYKSKATNKNLKVFVSTAIRVGIQMTGLSPKLKVIKKTPVNGKKPRKYLGVTVRINGSRQLVPGGFYTKAKKSGKELVLGRQGKGRYPTVALGSKILREAAFQAAPSVQNTLEKTFEEQLDSNIQYAMSKKLPTGDDK